MARHDPLDILDPDAARLARADEIAQRDLGRMDGHRVVGELPLGDEPIERPFEIAAVGDHRLGDIFEDRLGDIETAIDLAGDLVAAGEDAPAQIDVGRADLEGDAALEARADSFVEGFQFGRRTVGGDDDLTARVMSALI